MAGQNGRAYPDVIAVDCTAIQHLGKTLDPQFTLPLYSRKFSLDKNFANPSYPCITKYSLE